jgi:hypothetical protein
MKGSSHIRQRELQVTKYETFIAFVMLKKNGKFVRREETRGNKNGRGQKRGKGWEKEKGKDTTRRGDERKVR